MLDQGLANITIMVPTVTTYAENNVFMLKNPGARTGARQCNVPGRAFICVAYN